MGAKKIITGEQERDTDCEKPDLESVVLERNQEGGGSEGHGVGL